MESLFKAVGLGSLTPGPPLPGAGPGAAASGRAGGACGGGGAEASAQLSGEELLPDIARIAAATEPGILSLEEEARSLERTSLPDASAVLQRWAQGLRRRPRADEPLASFKAQFLRSNALEKAVESLRRHTGLRSALLDRPLVSSAAPGPGEALLGDLCKVAQLCMTRAAATLVELSLRTALLDPSPKRVAAALSTMRSQKEDWVDVVQGQAVRALERRLDSLAYELQKCEGARKAKLKAGGDGAPSEAFRRASHDRIAVLAALCTVIAGSRASAEARSGVELVRRPEPPAPAPASPVAVIIPKGDVNASGDDEKCPDAWPVDADCEKAISSMLSKTEQGMSEGLRLLALPYEPLRFVLGSELRVRGFDVREAVNALIAHWLQEEKNEFHAALRRLRAQLEEKPPAMMEERARIMEEREALLAKVRALDLRLAELNSRLGSRLQPDMAQSPPLTPPPAMEAPSAARPPLAGLSSPDSAGPRSALARAPSPLRLEVRPQQPILHTDSGTPTAEDLAAEAAIAAEETAKELQRSAERFATQLQQRRSQLVAGLVAHLNCERELVTSLAPAASSMANVDDVVFFGAAAAARERLEAILKGTQDLCCRVEVALGGSGASEHSEVMLGSGIRCKARWADGKFYDAVVQSVQGDGSVVLNWLRPRADSCGAESPRKRRLVTVIEGGGDDTLHRIVPREDVRPEGAQTGGVPDEQAAQRWFEARSPQDLVCFDCGATGADWASVSLGIYLCQHCASVHQGLGSRMSLVRQLWGGWGWIQRDLTYLQLGGNAALDACLRDYAEVRAMPTLERYATRFAEYYRRRLDAICTGAQLPSAPTPEVAMQASAGEFLSAAEVAAVVREATRSFEDVVRPTLAALSAIGPGSSAGRSMATRMD